MSGTGALDALYERATDVARRDSHPTRQRRPFALYIHTEMGGNVSKKLHGRDRFTGQRHARAQDRQ
jgi:hypothetical protein